MTDTEIINLFFERSEQAIEELAKKHGNAVARVARNILGNAQDTEECVNDTYLGTWNAIPPHHPLNLSTFIGKICRRLSINKWRSLSADKRGGGQATLSFEELEACIGDHTLNQNAKDTVLADTINQFLSELKESDRKVFVCRYWYFDSIEDIAARFSFSPSKTKMILKRTRDKLRDYLTKEGVMS